MLIFFIPQTFYNLLPTEVNERNTSFLFFSFLVLDITPSSSNPDNIHDDLSIEGNECHLDNQNRGLYGNSGEETSCFAYRFLKLDRRKDD
jgi:hypothetical protein